MASHDYLHIGRAADLRCADRALYRALEILPGALSLGTLLLLIALSFTLPAVVAYFTIAFSAYWLFKTMFLFVHLRHSFRRLTHHLAIDWLGRLTDLKYDDVV